MAKTDKLCQTCHSYVTVGGAKHDATATGIGAGLIMIKFKEALLADEAFKRIVALPVKQQATALKEYSKLYPFVVLPNCLFRPSGRMVPVSGTEGI